MARDKLVLSYLKFVVGPKCAGQFVNADHAAFNDLVQAGILGVFKAMTLFDYRRGVRFLSYARARILLHIRQELARRDIVAVPAWRRRVRKRVEQTRDKHISLRGCEPTEEYMCEVTQLSERQLQRIQGEDFAVCNVERIAPPPAPEVDPGEDEEARKVRGLVSLLPRYHQFILRSLYGFNATPTHTIKDVAEILGRSAAWVSRCRTEALLFLENKVALPG